MATNNIGKMADLVLTLRQKCLAKDRLMVKNFTVSYAEYNCVCLFFEYDVLSVKELADKLDITSGGVTRIITSLEEKGYLIREIDAEDRRGINVSLTPKGKEIAKEIRQTSLDIHEEILGLVGKEKAEVVLEGVKNLVGALEVWLKKHQ